MPTISERILAAVRGTSSTNQHNAAELRRERETIAQRITQVAIALGQCKDDTSPRYRHLILQRTTLENQDRELAYRLRLIEAEEAIPAARKAAAADVEAKLAEHQAQQQAQAKAGAEAERLQQRLTTVQGRIEAAEAAARARVDTARQALVQASAEGEPDEALADAMRVELRAQRDALEDLQPLRVQADVLAAELQARQAGAGAAQAAGEAALRALQAARAEVADVETDAAALAVHRADVHTALAGAGARLLLVGRWGGTSHHLRRLLGVPSGEHLLFGSRVFLAEAIHDAIRRPDPDSVLEVDAATVPDVSAYSGPNNPFMPTFMGKLAPPEPPRQVSAVHGR